MKIMSLSAIMFFSVSLASAASTKEALRLHQNLNFGFPSQQANVDKLIEEARSGSLEDRYDAIKELRTFAQWHEKAAELLRELAVRDKNELIRQRAAQSLGWTIGQPLGRYYKQAFETLKKVYEDDSSVFVRSMALKALHFATHDPDNKAFRDWILGIAQDTQLDSLVRAGALWALGSSATYGDVNPVLRALAKKSNEPASVRTQALKSLHLFMSDKECVSLALKEAQDVGQDIELREAATLFLWTMREDIPVKEALKKLLSDSSSRIREAAEKALDEQRTHRLEILKFFRFRYDFILHRPYEVLEME